MKCDNCGNEIPILKDGRQPYNSGAAGTAKFCIECGLHIVGFIRNGEYKWTYVPKGKFPVYRNGDFIGFTDKAPKRFA